MNSRFCSGPGNRQSLANFFPASLWLIDYSGVIKKGDEKQERWSNMREANHIGAPLHFCLPA
jgi:hypothetical protein